MLKKSKKKQTHNRFYNLVKDFFEESKFLKYIIVYLLTMLSLVSLLFAVIKFIPFSAVKDNVIESVKQVNDEYIRGSHKFYDRYDIGEVMIVEANYFFDENEPIKSLIEMKYIDSGMFFQLHDREKISSAEYSRYWIGMVIYTRVLFLFTDINGIRVVNAIVFLTLSLILFHMLFKESKILGISFVISLIAVSFHVFISSVQYIAVPLVAIISSIILVKLYKKESKHIDLLLFITGLATAFFDMLTTETLTITLPMFILCYLSIKDGKKISFRDFIKYLLLWGIGYAASFFTKWLIDMIYYGFDYFSFIFSRAMIRVTNRTFYCSNIFELLLADFSLLYPMCEFKYGYIFTIALLILFNYYFLFKFDKKKNIYLILICFIPILRFFVIFSHSELLYNFTFRAIIPIIMLIVIVCYTYISKLIKNIKLNTILHK